MNSTVNLIEAVRPLVCSCCGQFTITAQPAAVAKHGRGAFYRLTGYGSIICEVQTIPAVVAALANYGKGLEDFAAVM